MKTNRIVILSLLFLASLNAFSAYDPLSNDVFTPGGSDSGAQSSGAVPSTSANTLKLLYANTSSMTAGNYLTLYDAGAPYKVPAGKTFVAQEYWVFTTAVGDNFEWLTSTSAQATNDTSTTPTGVIYYMGAASRSSAISDAALLWRQYRIPVTFGAGTWPGLQTIGTNTNRFTLMIYGREI